MLRLVTLWEIFWYLAHQVLVNRLYLKWLLINSTRMLQRVIHQRWFRSFLSTVQILLLEILWCLLCQRRMMWFQRYRIFLKHSQNQVNISINCHQENRNRLRQLSRAVVSSNQVMHLNVGCLLGKRQVMTRLIRCWMIIRMVVFIWIKINTHIRPVVVESFSLMSCWDVILMCSNSWWTFFWIGNSMVGDLVQSGQSLLVQTDLVMMQRLRRYGTVGMQHQQQKTVGKDSISWFQTLNLGRNGQERKDVMNWFWNLSLMTRMILQEMEMVNMLDGILWWRMHQKMLNRLHLFLHVDGRRHFPVLEKQRLTSQGRKVRRLRICLNWV